MSVVRRPLPFLPMHAADGASPKGSWRSAPQKTLITSFSAIALSQSLLSIPTPLRQAWLCDGCSLGDLLLLSRKKEETV
jgi:hypothetical protein